MKEGQFNRVFNFSSKEGEQKKKEEIAPDKRQQNKIIAVLESGNFDLISEKQINMEDGQREKFLQKIAKGKISEEKFREFLLNITPPVANEPDKGNPVNLFDSISGNKQMRGFLAEFGKGDFNQRESLNPKDLAAFLQKYPEPSMLEKNMQFFLDRIEKLNSPQKRKEYEISLKEFTRVIYGKRQEYYDQIKLLRFEADAKFQKQIKEKELNQVSRNEIKEGSEKIARKMEINEAQTFQELYEILEEKGGIKSSNQFYNFFELKNIIEKVRKGELASAYITRAEGLRSRVEYIIKFEELRKNSQYN